MKIAFFGATGMLGTPVAHQLVEAGFSVNALVRDAQKAARKLPKAVHCVVGDLNQPEAIAQTLAGCDAVYLNLSVPHGSKPTDFIGEREGLTAILSAAQKAGIQRIGYCSSLVQRYQNQDGFNWWIFDIKQWAIQTIKNAGIPYFIFYPSSFMENFDQGGFRQKNKIVLAGKSHHPMYFIAGADYGKQVASAFKQHHQLPSLDFPVQGPEALTNEQAADIFVAHYKHAPLSIQKAPLGILKFIGIFNPTLRDVSKILQAINHYPERFESELTNQTLGTPSIKLSQYAAQFAV